MTLSNFGTRIIKVVQANHQQGYIRYGMSRGIQCLCMSLMSVCWKLFKSVSIWDSFDLDCILQKGDVLSTSLNNYKYLGIEDLPQENILYLIEYLDIRTGGITNCWRISCVYY